MDAVAADGDAAVLEVAVVEVGGDAAGVLVEAVDAMAELLATRPDYASGATTMAVIDEFGIAIVEALAAQPN